MKLVYSLFFYLSYVTPAYGDIIFHPSIGLASGAERAAINNARASIEETAQINSAPPADDEYLENVAIELVETRENQDILLGKSL